MANAKRCDICGEYYQVPDVGFDRWDEGRNSNMIRFLKLKNISHIDHDVFHFDSCDECLQDVMDYILTKQVEWKKSDAE